MNTTKKPESWRDKELPENKAVDDADKDANPARALKNPVTTKNEPRVNESPDTPASRDPHRTPQDGSSGSGKGKGTSG